MYKSPQDNQLTELKQCKSEVEEIFSPKPGNWLSQHLYLKKEMLGTMLGRIPLKKLCLKVVKLGSCMKQ